MVGQAELIKILDKYGLDGKKMIENNSNILEYGNPKEIDKILDYLINDLKCTTNAVEKCPSILSFANLATIKENYKYLSKTELEISKIKNTLSVLGGNLENIKYNYEYLKRKLGIEKLNKTLSIINMDSLELTKICRYFEEKFGIEKLKNCISGISGIYSKYEKVVEVLDLELFKNHPELLTPSVFLKTSDEIEKIVGLELFKSHPELLTPSVFLKTSDEIEKIVSLELFKTHPELLTPSVFMKTSEQISETYKFLTEELGMPELVTRTTMFYISKKELIAKINFLNENGLLLITGNRINSIFGMSNKTMQKKYGISKKELVQKYYEEDINKDRGR